MGDLLKGWDKPLDVTLDSTSFDGLHERGLAASVHPSGPGQLPGWRRLKRHLTTTSCTRVDAALSFLSMKNAEDAVQALAIREPEMSRLARAWEFLRPEQKEDLIYLAQSMVNRNRKELRKATKHFARAA